MRTVFYAADKRWTGNGRAFVRAARGLSDRGHQVTFICCAHGDLEMQAISAGLDVVTIPREASMAGDAWWLRNLLKERFIEVVLVHGERRQMVVSGAMRLAERGAVIRRVAPFEALDLRRTGKLATRVAANGVLFSTEWDLEHAGADGFAIPPAIAPLGITAGDVASRDEAARAALGLPTRATIITCAYDPSARNRLLAVLRTIALLAPRHTELHLAVSGPGSEDEALRLSATALGIGHLVTFLGDRGADQSHVRVADVGWVIARGDDGAYALLDCMANALPVLTERDQFSEHYVADGICGILLPMEEPAAIVASAVAAFLADAEQRAAMGAAGRARVVREFGESAFIDGFEQALADAGDRTRWATR